MKKIVLASFLLFGSLALGQAPEVDPFPPVEMVDEVVVPVISVEDKVKVNDEILLDASTSKVLSVSDNGLPSFSWVIFKNGESIDTKFTKAIKYTFVEPGVYKIKLNIKQGSFKSSVEKEVLVYDSKAIFVTDKNTDYLEINVPAAEQGIWLKKIVLDGNGTEFTTEEDFIYKFQENLDFIKESDVFIFASDSNLDIVSFARFWQKLSPENLFSLEDKALVRITENKLDKELKLTQPVFEILQKTVLLSHKEILPLLFSKLDFDSIVDLVDNQGYDYRLVNMESRPSAFRPLKNLISYLSKNGVALAIIYLLLAVPFLAFIIAFARQFIGISTFGVFAPLMLSLSFMVLGLKFGLSVFMTVLIVSYFIRVFFEKVELLYIPRLALLMSVLSLSFFLILALAIYMGTSLNLALTIFPMMVMSTISEKFIASQTKEGLRNAIVAAIETIFVAFLAYSFVEIEWVRSTILSSPEFIFLPMIGNVFLGKFTGLRVAEYFRFRSLLMEDTQE